MVYRWWLKVASPAARRSICKNKKYRLSLFAIGFFTMRDAKWISLILKSSVLPRVQPLNFKRTSFDKPVTKMEAPEEFTSRNGVTNRAIHRHHVQGILCREHGGKKLRFVWSSTESHCPPPSSMCLLKRGKQCVKVDSERDLDLLDGNRLHEAFHLPLRRDKATSRATAQLSEPSTPIYID